MMRYILIAVAMLTLACTVRGQERTQPYAAPEVDQTETIRRGDYREELGTVKSGPEQVALSALEPPADDSDRWHLNIIITKDQAYSKQCQDLVSAFSTAIPLRAWADVDNPEASWGHLDIKDIDDPKLADWFAAIRPQLAGKPFPAIVLQPPRNGSFGRNALTVGIIHGYNGDPEYISGRIRAKIKAYADKFATLQAARESRAANSGHSQRHPSGERSPAPTVDHSPSRNPAEWPDLTPPPPKTLTYQQIRKQCPEAPVAWVRDQVKAGLTSEDELLEAYDEFLEEKHPEAKPDTENPTHWTGSSSDVLLVIGLGVGIVLLYRWYQQSRANKSSS